MQYQPHNAQSEIASKVNSSYRKIMANRSKKTILQIFAKIKQRNSIASARNNLVGKAKFNKKSQQPENTMQNQSKCEKSQIQTVNNSNNNNSKILSVQQQKRFSNLSIQHQKLGLKIDEGEEHQGPYNNLLKQASEIQLKLKQTNYAKITQKTQENKSLILNQPQGEKNTPHSKIFVTPKYLSPQKIRDFLEKQRNQKQITSSKSQKQLFSQKPSIITPSKINISQRKNSKILIQPKKQNTENLQSKNEGKGRVQLIKLYKNSFDLQRKRLLNEISTNTSTTRSQLYNKCQNVNAFSVKNLSNLNINITTDEITQEQLQTNKSEKKQNYSFNSDYISKNTAESTNREDKSFLQNKTNDYLNQSKVSSNAYSFSILKEMKPNLKDIDSEQSSISSLNNSILDVCSNKNSSSQFLTKNYSDLTPSSLFAKLNSPLTQKLVLQIFRQNLTAFEIKEINDYDQIFFLGLEAKKTQPNLLSQQNLDYDDENGDYKVVFKDHIAYRYETLEVLGKGSFGQVIRCFDHKRKEMCAVKMIRNKKRFHQQAAVEVKILSYMKERDFDHDFNIVHLKNYFLFRQHLCIVFELLSINLFEVIKKNNFQGLSPGYIKRFGTQILQSLKFLYQHKIIHCDLKPENILLSSQQSNSQIKIIDFGSSCFESEKMYTYIQSRFYRAPEIILGLPYDMTIDM